MAEEHKLKSPSVNSIPLNPFENTTVRSYSHKPYNVPPYVLDRLSQAHYKDQLNNTNVNVTQGDMNASLKSVHKKDTNDDEYMTFANDLFVKTMDNSWNKFLHSFQDPQSYPAANDNGDMEKDFNDNLQGSWGGDERLKSALLRSQSSDEDTYVNERAMGWLSTFNIFKHKHKPSNQGHQANEFPKVRSKAGYWMSYEKRADLIPTLNKLFVLNPLAPLLLRICIIFFSLCSLALACTIFHYSNKQHEGIKIPQQPSIIMAIVVQCCAIVYVSYIAYDEYSGKPLGLRDPLGKMKLIMLDLLFIIFSSADLSLTFNTLYDDEWVCTTSTFKDVSYLGYIPTVGSICRRQRALAAFLFLVNCLWLFTFTISIIRVVGRVSVEVERN